MNTKRKSNILPFVLIVFGGVMLAALLLVVLHPMVVFGNADDKAQWEAFYPAAFGSRIDNCLLCHTTMTGPVRNPYGQAVENLGEVNPPIGNIENLDSDGDGFTNLQEIQMHTYPGDPNDHPQRFFIPDAIVK